MKLIPILIAFLMIIGGLMVIIPSNNVQAVPVTTLANEQFAGSTNFVTELTGPWAGGFSYMTNRLGPDSYYLGYSGAGGRWYGAADCPLSGNATGEIHASFNVYVPTFDISYESVPTFQFAFVIGSYVSPGITNGLGIAIDWNGAVESIGQSGGAYYNLVNTGHSALSGSAWHSISFDYAISASSYNITIDNVNYIMPTGGYQVVPNNIWVLEGLNNEVYINDVVVTSSSNSVQITSSPITQIKTGTNYYYNFTANQPGTWTIIKPSWLAVTGQNLHGIAPRLDANYSIKIKISNPNGTAYQNYSLLAGAFVPHFGIVEILSANGTTGVNELVTWPGNTNGVLSSPAGTSIQDLYCTFYPETTDARMSLDLKIWANNSLSYQHTFFPVIANGTINTAYAFSTMNLTSHIGITTNAGVPYYILLVMNMTNGTGMPIPSAQFSGSISSSANNSPQQNWIASILWILLLFTVPWLMNWFIPRYGMMIGLILMAIVLGMSNSSFLVVSMLIIFTVAVQGYVLSREGT